MKKYKDIEIGDVYGRWTVIEKGKYTKWYDKNGKMRSKQFWVCQCSCEDRTIKEVNGEALKNSGSTSCGCINKDNALERGKKQAVDITNKRFGSLIAIKSMGYTDGKRKRALWLFKCDCGNEVTLRKEDVTTGHTKSCGCLCLNDLTGKKFERLLVLNKDEYWTKKYKTSTYKCQCDCGNIKYIRQSSLVQGVIKSCGCINKEIENLMGKRFGKLTVLRFINKKYYDNASINMWECECDCGNIIVVAQNNLKSGNTQSCGCQVRSHGEIKTAKILNNWDFNFDEQYRFDDCKYKYTLPFDFAIKDNNDNILCLIEYDGKFHYMAVKYPDMTQEQADKNLEETKIRDEIKNKYCKDNNIPLIRIPYWELNNMEYFLWDKLVENSMIKELHSA